MEGGKVLEGNCGDIIIALYGRRGQSREGSNRVRCLQRWETTFESESELREEKIILDPSNFERTP